MSRLIVKNLPNHISDQKLKEHFSAQGGTITDVKLIHRPDGLSRRFAFLGFKSDDEAAKAKQYFDRSYMGTSRISVLVVDPTKPTSRPTKRQRLDPSPSHPPPQNVQKESQPAPTASTSRSPNDAPPLSEFLEVMKPRTKKERTWANSDDPAPSSSTIPPTESPSRKGKGKQPSPPPEGQSKADEEVLSDLEWMRRRTQAVEDVNETAMEVQPIAGEEKPTISEDDSIEESLKDSPRLYLRNIPYTCTSSDLEEAFSKFGPLEQVHIPAGTDKSSKGIAFVTFLSADSALAAQKAMHRSTFQGRILHAMPAVSRRVKADPNDKRSVKDQAAEKRKANANKEFSWGMLYMNSDAVVSSVADRLKISKADILNPESDDAAVKLALAETHVIQETKKYLEDEGVILDSFKGKGRSDTTILIKNIPYGTTTSELSEIFAPHGEIVRLLLPPAGTIAVVEFANVGDASKAFRSVAYRRLKNSIIYLEKAPVGMFRDPAPGGEEPRISSGVKPVRADGSRLDPSTQTAPLTDDPAETETSTPAAAAAGATLFVKNLSFGTTSDKLSRTFKHLPSFAFARVQTKPDPKSTVPGATLSMGYGFVGFKDREAAQSALKAMAGFVLDGHSLDVKFAQRGADEGAGADGEAGKPKTKTTKMIAKNLPFEATKKDIRILFGSHGQLKSVRLPKKFNSSSRGFAFLEFVSHKEAQNAMDALKHTHLLGRHVVLEWAEDNGAGGDLEVLRERVRAGYGDGKEGRIGKKRKLNMDLDGGEDEDGEGGFVAL